MAELYRMIQLKYWLPSTSCLPFLSPYQAKDELDRLIKLEYWLRFDFTGAVRKLLPVQQLVRDMWRCGVWERDAGRSQ